MCDGVLKLPTFGQKTGLKLKARKYHRGMTTHGRNTGTENDHDPNILSGLCNGQLKLELECGPMSNVMATLPNIGGAHCSTPQSLADTHY